LPILRNIIKIEKPNILHAHYATSYGVLGALLKFKPFFLSVWGSDVYLFPNKSFIHKSILRYSLKNADVLLSTSCAMKKETFKYVDKNIKVIPFGVDIHKFRLLNDTIDNISNSVTIGTVKGLEKVYGIEYLIKGFKIVFDKNPEISLKLLIVGKGNQESLLKALVKNLNLENQVIFTGYIESSEIVKYHNSIDIEVFMSESESFGVSVIEASACENPVIVSNVGGLPKVVDNNNTGYIVKNKDFVQLSEKLQILLLDPNLRKKMGKKGRQLVKDKYNWENNVLAMSKVYENYKKGV
jgi:glycosyltransferase involved in cell wall biosynthesis